MTKLLRGFLSFFRPQNVVSPLPGGVVPDKVGMWGLYGLMANVNAYVQDAIAAITTAGTDSTITAAQLLSGLVQLNTGASGGFTITLPSTANILTELGRATIPTDGTFSKLIRFINNNVGQTGTVTAGDASTTVTGTATVATNTTRTFVLNVVAGGATITLTNIGTATL